MATALDLESTRRLSASLEAENAALAARLESEKRSSALLAELNAARRGEADALKDALDARDKAIAAREELIASQEKLIASLRSKKRGVLARVGDILLGAATVVVLK